MEGPVKRLLVAAVAAASCLGVAHAQENQSYQCLREGDQRSVAVEYSMDGAGAKSCSVMYTKQSQPAKELWHYEAHADQCQVQAEQFLKKLEGFGLTCSAASKTAMMKQ
jgi:hypothetical protein